MAGKSRERLKRIAEWYSRVGSSRYDGQEYAALFELEALCTKLLAEKLDPAREALFDVFPLRAVAHIEVFTRLRLKSLIDYNSSFLENAAQLADTIKIDHVIGVALQSRKITIGDLIAHEVSVSSPADLVRCFDAVLGGNFKRSLAEMEDRWLHEVDDERSGPIIDDIEQLFQQLSRLFDLRHKLAHEASSEQPYNQEELPCLMQAAAKFVLACNELVDLRTHGLVPLTQVEMNSQSQDVYGELARQLSDEIAKVRSSEIIDHREFDEVQAAWATFAEKEARLLASLFAGGSMQSMMYNDVLSKLTLSRLERLKFWSELEEGGSWPTGLG